MLNFYQIKYLDAAISVLICGASQTLISQPLQTTKFTKVKLLFEAKFKHIQNAKKKNAASINFIRHFDRLSTWQNLKDLDLGLGRAKRHVLNRRQQHQSFGYKQKRMSRRRLGCLLEFA